MQAARFALLAILAIVPFNLCRAENICDPLRPNPPRNMSQEVAGKLDAKVDGLASRILKLDGNIEGTYRNISTDVLKEYPNADKLYLWDRTIYLYCITLSQSHLDDMENSIELKSLWTVSVSHLRRLKAISI